MKKILFSPELLKKAERWVIVLVGVTVLVTLAVTFLASDDSLIDNLHSLPVGAMVWLTVATVFENAPRFWRYHIAARALGIRVPWWRMLYYHTVGYALLPTPGKIGVLIRLWLLKHHHQVPYRRSAPLIVMDFLSDSIAMFALAALALVVVDDPRLTLLGVLMATGLAASLAFTLSAPQVMRRMLKVCYRLTGKRGKRLFARLLTLVHTAKDVLGWKVLISTTLLSFVAWAVLAAAIAHFVTQMGAPLSNAAAVLALTLSTIGGFITMMPAGIGGTEFTMVGIFAWFGVPLVTAVLATAVIRVITFWLTVLVGLVLLPLALRTTPRR